MTNKDKTGTERQQRRRKIEKLWLKNHGYKSWENLHTDLLNGKLVLINLIDNMIKIGDENR